MKNIIPKDDNERITSLKVTRKKYYENNKDKIKEYKKEWRKKNRDKINKYYREYYKNNRNKINKYYEKNKDKIKERNKKACKKYYENNKDKIKEYQKEYNLKNRDKINKYYREYYKNNEQKRFSLNLRTKINRVIKRGNGIKAYKTIDLLGCSIKEVRLHLEKQFQDNMSWDNYGNWHIDHIRPCCSFDLTQPDEQKICFHYTNLQPLWAIDNLKKGGKYDITY